MILTTKVRATKRKAGTLSTALEKVKAKLTLLNLQPGDGVKLRLREPIEISEITTSACSTMTIYGDGKDSGEFVLVTVNLRIQAENINLDKMECVPKPSVIARPDH